MSKYSENKLADMRKGNVGFIFQSFNLIDELNVYENVELPLLYQNVGEAAAQEPRARGARARRA